MLANIPYMEHVGMSFIRKNGDFMELQWDFHDEIYADSKLHMGIPWDSSDKK